MRNLIKKSLACLLVAALALTCFVGTLTVSAEDIPTATIVIKADDVEAGAKEIPVTFTVTSTLGINEALIKVSSNLGDIIAQPKVVVDEGVGTAIADPAVENPTDYNSFFLSAVSPDGQPETVMGEVKKATISAVFVNEAGLVAGDYFVDVEIPEGKVIAASKDEVAIKLECTKLEIVVEEKVEGITWDQGTYNPSTKKTTFTNSNGETIVLYEYGKNLTQQDAISINYYANLSGTYTDIDYSWNSSNYGLLVWRTEPESYTYGTHETELASTRQFNTKYGTFRYQGVSAKEMNDTVYTVIYVKVGDTYLYGQPTQYSVATYLYNQYAKSSNLKELAYKDVAISMLNYGAAAQVYYNYNYDNDESRLANYKLTAEEKVLVEPEAIDDRNKSLADDITASSTDSWYGVNLTFKALLQLNYYVRKNETAATDRKILVWNEEDYKASNVHDINSTTAVVYDADEVPQYNGKYPQAIVPIYAKNMRTSYYARVACLIDGEWIYTDSYKYSVENYVASQIIKKNEGTLTDINLYPLVCEMLNYGDKADYYFTNFG